MNLTGLFATPVCSFNFGRSIDTDVMSFVENQERLKSFSSDVSVDTYVLDQPEMSAIKDFIEESLKVYVDTVFSPPDDTTIEITQSWLNYQGTNGSHHRHYHPNSFISGVFYVDAEDNVDNISFYNPRQDAFKIESIFYNEYNTDQMTFPISRGDLILFPSYLPHSVEQRTRDDKQRISLAFNTFITGIIGSKRGLTELFLGEKNGKGI
jgi:uncharacterized protein (TIGR02466 family)